jgi:hypothetical protein
MEMSDQLHAFAAIPLDISPDTHCIVGFQSRSGPYKEEKKFFPLPGMELRPYSS